MSVRRTYDDVKIFVNKMGFSLLEEYRVGYVQRVIIQDCNQYKYDVVFSSLYYNKYPEFINLKNPFSLHNMEIWLKNNTKFSLFGANEYRGNKELLNFYCPTCDDVFCLSWDNIHGGHGCGICDGKQTGKKHSFADIHPELLIEWSNKNNISPYGIVSGYRKEKIIWLCSVCQYEWKDFIKQRLKSKGCPVCSGEILSDKNRFSLVYPEIASEWHPTKNGDLTPDDFTYGSGKVVWWLCENLHEYKTPINRRTNMKSGCPKCKTSKGEKRIKHVLTSANLVDEQDFISQYRFGDCKNTFSLPFDFYLPNYNVAIEYHGEQHYRVREKNDLFGGKEGFRKRKINDQIKENYCKDNNINLLIIPYWEFDNIEQILQETLFE